MAGPSSGGGLVQGAAAGFQGQSLGIEQLLHQLRAQAMQGQLQDQQAQRAGTGGAYDAMLQLFGSDAAPGGQLMPTSPAPGQPSVPLQQAGAPPPAAMPPQGGASPQMDLAGTAAPPMPASTPQPMSPARAVLQGAPVPPQQAAQPGGAPKTLQDIIKIIDAKMPNAPPQAKMAALQQVSGMLDASSQRQFQQMKGQFEMQMKVAELNQKAEHYLQQSLDRNASIEQRAEAARHHQETLVAMSHIAASARRDVAGTNADSRREVQGMKSDQAALNRALREELGTRKLGQEDTKIENLKAYRDERVRLEAAGLDEKEARRLAYERVQAAHDQTRRDVVGTQQQGAMDRTRLRVDAHSAEHAAALDLRDRVANMNLTPEQKLMSNQLRSLTSRYGAIVQGAGPNSPAAKAMNGQIQTLTQQLEATVNQSAPPRVPTPVPGQPVQPNAQTRPPIPPALIGKDLQVGQTADGKWMYRDKATGDTYDSRGQPLGPTGGADTDGGGGEPPEEPKPKEPRPKVVIKGRSAPSIVDAVWGKGPPVEDDSALAELNRARRGAGARDARGRQ